MTAIVFKVTVPNEINVSLEAVCTIRSDSENGSAGL